MRKAQYHIVVDIETVPGPVPPSLEEIEAPANYKDPSKIEAYKIGKQYELWGKQALDPLACQVVCIGLAAGDDEPSALIGRPSSGEEDLIRGLSSVTESYRREGSITWIGHNAAGFDLPILKLRALKYGFRELANSINLDRYKGNVEDTMLMAGLGYGKYASLDAMAKFFGLPSKSGHGSDVWDWWQAGEFVRIAAYCCDDVALTRDLWRVLSGLPVKVAA